MLDGVAFRAQRRAEVVGPAVDAQQHLQSSWEPSSTFVGPAHLIQWLHRGISLASQHATQHMLAINICCSTDACTHRPDCDAWLLLGVACFRSLIPLDTVASATPAGDVLNISFVSGQPDLLLQVRPLDPCSCHRAILRISNTLPQCHCSLLVFPSAAVVFGLPVQIDMRMKKFGQAHRIVYGSCASLRPRTQWSVFL